MRKKKTHYTLIYEYGSDILKSEVFQGQDQFIQHGNITVKQHCISVANASIKFAERLHIHYQKRALIRGALLHDYFLYDWHLPHKENNWHGFRHAKIALKNASRDYKLDKYEIEIIKKHMWPLTIIRLNTGKHGSSILPIRIVLYWKPFISIKMRKRNSRSSKTE